MGVYLRDFRRTWIKRNTESTDQNVDDSNESFEILDREKGYLFSISMLYYFDCYYVLHFLKDSSVIKLSEIKTVKEKISYYNSSLSTGIIYQELKVTIVF